MSRTEGYVFGRYEIAQMAKEIVVALISTGKNKNCTAGELAMFGVDTAVAIAKQATEKTEPRPEK